MRNEGKCRSRAGGGSYLNGRRSATGAQSGGRVVEEVDRREGGHLFGLLQNLLRDVGRADQQVLVTRQDLELVPTPSAIHHHQQEEAMRRSGRRSTWLVRWL